MYGLA